MANPASSGTFDLWITAQIPFPVIAPKSGDTGAMDIWITAQTPFPVYQEASTTEISGSLSSTLGGVSPSLAAGVEIRGWTRVGYA